MTLAILTAIAALCAGNHQCVRDTRKCFTDRSIQSESKINICFKQKPELWDSCEGLALDETKTIYDCWQESATKHKKPKRKPSIKHIK